MESLFDYLLKASGMTAIFYLVYRLFLHRETFFRGNRHFLLTGMIASSILPFVSLTRYTTMETAAGVNPTVFPVSYLQEQGPHQPDWLLLICLVYLAGVLLFLLQFLIQLCSLRRMLGKSPAKMESGFSYKETDRVIPPFSFFRNIVYNPSQYHPEELEAILAHERVHSSQWHSVDSILARLFTIFFWMNPISWIYRYHVEQNLEFLADAIAIKELHCVKTYQKTLLKVSGNQFYSPVTTNFYSSLIKKRIVMLHKSRSNKQNSWKYLLPIPLILAFILMFQTRVIAQDKPHPDREGHQPPFNMDIHKQMTDVELSDLKERVRKELGGELKYSGVGRNDGGDITRIKIAYSDTDGNSAAANFDKSGGIPTIHFGSDGNGGIFISGNGDDMEWARAASGTYVTEYDREKSRDDRNREWGLRKPRNNRNEHRMVWSNDYNNDNRTIMIEDINGKKTIKVDGKEVTEEEFEAMQEDGEKSHRHVTWHDSSDGSDSSLFILKEDQNAGEKGKGFFYIDSEGGNDPLFFIDGVASSFSGVKALSPDRFKSIQVLKDAEAVMKYGPKAKDGAIEITTNE